jgi:hypothetical protein
VKGNYSIWGVGKAWSYDESSELLKCRGCGNVTFRITEKSEGEEEPYIIYYPPAIARRTPDWLREPSEIPNSVQEVMSEVYSAVQNDLRRLAAMGIRATLENVMKDKIGKDLNFNDSIDQFQKSGYLSMRQSGSLSSIVEAGHAATHRGWEPTDDDMDILLDITESIIETAYLHERRAHDLEKRIPIRRDRRSRRDPSD